MATPAYPIIADARMWSRRRRRVMAPIEVTVALRGSTRRRAGGWG